MKTRLVLIVVAIASLIFTGCATPGPSYKETLQTYVGKSNEVVIRQFGVPSGSFDQGSIKVLEFSSQLGNAMIPLMGTWQSIARYCKTTFFLDQSNLVTSFKYEGNVCQ